MSYEGPQFYDNAAVFQTYMQHRQSPDNPNDTLEKPIMLALLGPVRGVHLLDLGCGDAALGKHSWSKGQRPISGWMAPVTWSNARNRPLPGPPAG